MATNSLPFNITWVENDEDHSSYQEAYYQEAHEVFRASSVPALFPYWKILMEKVQGYRLQSPKKV